MANRHAHLGHAGPGNKCDSPACASSLDGLCLRVSTREYPDTRNEGRAIRMRAARHLAENSAPHDERTYYQALEQCEACAILGDSLRLLASLENA